MDYKHIACRREGPVFWVILNRPEKLNAFNIPLGEDLLSCLQSCERDETVRVVVITGAGRAFCTGDDISEKFPAGVEQYLQGPGRWPRSAKLVREMPKPVIAMVNGHSHGAGFDLALACDFRIVSSEATFSHAYVLRGLASGIAFLPRYVGIGKATELLFTGRRLTAKEAEELGLVTKVVRTADLESTTREFAKQLAQGATQAMGIMKVALNLAWNVDFNRALELQANAAAAAIDTEDAKEGKRAFVEKRPPKFTGR